MPTFDFFCHECNHQFEHLSLPGAKEEKLLTCPKCNSNNVKKLLSPPNIKFKGSGFYVNDSKKDK